MTGSEPGGTKDGDPPARQTVYNVIIGSTITGPVYQAGAISDVSYGFLPSSSLAPGQLPAGEPGFTGRDRELARVLSALGPDAGTDAVLVSAIAGMAGIGKTELAVQAGHAAVARGWFPGGVIFLNLHGYDPSRNPMTGVAAVDQALRALGAAPDEIPADPDERIALYRSRLAAASGPVLIVADNALTAAQVEPLRPGTGRHKMIVTSRDTLPQFGAQLIDLDTLAELDAVALLDVLLRLARPDDERISADRQAALSVARLCGFLPLALQIAGALLVKDPGQPVAELAAQLRGAPNRPALLDDKHRAVIPVFELSYRQLDRRAARIFRLFTVNPGPDLATRAVAVLAGEGEDDVRGILDGLADAHIIERVTTVRGRWRMHDLLREYAQQVAAEAAQADQRDAALDRLVGCYQETADAAYISLFWPTDPPEAAVIPAAADALAWLEAEYPNLVAMIVHARGTGRDHAAKNLARTIAPFLAGRCHVDDLLAVTKAGRAAAHDLGADWEEAGMLIGASGALRTARRFAEAAAACREAVDICARTGDPGKEAAALGALAAVLVETRAYDEALTVCERAEDLLGDGGDDGDGGDGTDDDGVGVAVVSAALVLNNHALALVELDRAAEALPRFRRAVQVLQGKDMSLLAAVLNNLGLTLLHLDETEEALTVLREAADIARDSAQAAYQVMALSNLAFALRDMRKGEEALASIGQALTLARALGNRHMEAEALFGLDQMLYAVGRYPEALAAGREAAQIFAEMADDYGQAAALQSVGQTLQRLKRPREAASSSGGAADCFRESARLYRQVGDHRGAGTVLKHLGDALRDSGDHAAAVAYLQACGLLWDVGNESGADEALDSLGLALKKTRRWDPAEIVQATGGYPGAPVVLTDLSLALTGLGRLEEAEQLCRQAAAECLSSGDRHGEGVAADRLSRVLRRRGRYDEALACAREALAIAEQTGSRRDAASAWDRIGWCLLATQRHDDAFAALRTSVGIYREVGVPYLLAGSVDNLGDALVQARRWDEAIAAYTEAAANYHDASRKKEAWATFSLGYALLRARRYDEAIDAARKAQRYFEGNVDGWRAGLPRGIIWRARIYRFFRRKAVPRPSA